MKAKSDFLVLVTVLLTRRGNNNNNNGARERGEASRAAGEKIDSGPSEMRPCTHLRAPVDRPASPKLLSEF